MLLFLKIKSDEENLNAATNGNMTDIIRDVPVEVYYDDENLVVTGVPKTVDMTIEGPTSLVQSAKQLQDFTVFVDLRTLNMDEHNVMLQVENVSDKLEVTLDPSYIEVNIEEKITREMRVDAEFNERLLAENFIVTGMKTDPERVLITGARSVIESISFVKATVGGEQGLNKTFTQEASVKVLDKDLSKLNVTIEPAQVDVTIAMEEYSREVPIDLRQIGPPKEGVVINDLTPSFGYVRVYGNRAVVDALDAIKVDVDVSKLEESKELTLKIPVPKGASRVSESQLEVLVDVTPAPEEEPVPDESAQAGQTDEKTEVKTTAREFAGVNVEVKGLDEEDRFSFTQPDSGQVP
jgi:YbbR domain-containing protein